MIIIVKNIWVADYTKITLFFADTKKILRHHTSGVLYTNYSYDNIDCSKCYSLEKIFWAN